MQLNELTLTCDDPALQLALLPETFSLTLSAPFDAALEVTVQATLQAVGAEISLAGNLQKPLSSPVLISAAVWSP